MEGHPAVPGRRAQDGLVVVEGALHGTEGHRAAGAALWEWQDGAPPVRDRGRPWRCRIPRNAHLELAEPVLPWVARARLLLGGAAATASARRGRGMAPSSIPACTPRPPRGLSPSLGPGHHRAEARLGVMHPHGGAGAGTTKSPMGPRPSGAAPQVGGSKVWGPPTLPLQNQAEIWRGHRAAPRASRDTCGGSGRAVSWGVGEWGRPGGPCSPVPHSPQAPPGAEGDTVPAGAGAGAPGSPGPPGALGRLTAGSSRGWGLRDPHRCPQGWALCGGR